MGCDIHSFTEVKDGDEWIFEEWGPFDLDTRDYVWFAFLAGVRRGDLPVIAQPRGLPSGPMPDAFFDWDYHSHSWLTVQELVDYDYDEPLNGTVVTMRMLLGERFFHILDHLSTKVGYEGVKLSDIRVVFAFDN